jgi:DNA-binding XRE family transcriptional regulator
MVNSVADRRRELGMSQRDLAIAAEIAQATIVKIEANDGYAPSGTVQVKIASALESETQKLFWSEDFAEAVAS